MCAKLLNYPVTNRAAGPADYCTDRDALPFPSTHPCPSPPSGSISPCTMSGGTQDLLKQSLVGQGRG